MKENAEILMQNLSSDDEQLVSDSIDQLAELHKIEAVPIIIDLLRTSKSYLIKHSAAYALHKLKDRRALEPLIDAIADPINKNYNSPFVYACTVFDCTKYLNFFVDLIVEQKLAVAISSRTVIRNMKGPFNKKVLQQNINKLSKALNESSYNESPIEQALNYLEEELHEL